MHAIAPKSGTETACGKLTGSAAMASNPTFYVTLTGPVATLAVIAGGAQPNGASL